MSSLPYDLLCDILSRLPGKTLIRFKTVSKHFHSLISDPGFQRLHHDGALNVPFALHAVSDSPSCYREILEGTKLRLFITDKDNELLSEFTTQVYGKNFKFLPSHHQLVCFLCSKQIYLCDPNTQMFLELPESDYGLFSSPSYFTGFGFLPSTMEYKVVRLVYNCLDDSFDSLRCEVLIVSTTANGCFKVSSWTMLETECPYPVHDFPVLANGYLHWKIDELAKKSEHNHIHILSFSLQDEKFLVLPAPPCFYTQNQELVDHRFKLVGIRGNLYVIDYNVCNLVMEIWVLKDWKNYVWVKQHRIEFKETEGFSPRLHYRCFPMEVLDIQTHRILFHLLYPSRLQCYDVARKTIDDYGQIQERFQFCHYTDGLLSLKNADVRFHVPSYD